LKHEPGSGHRQAILSRPAWARELKLDRWQGFPRIAESRPAWARELKPRKAVEENRQITSRPAWARELKPICWALVPASVSRAPRGRVN